MIKNNQNLDLKPPENIPIKISTMVIKSVDTNPVIRDEVTFLFIASFFACCSSCSWRFFSFLIARIAFFMNGYFDLNCNRDEQALSGSAMYWQSELFILIKS